MSAECRTQSAERRVASLRFYNKTLRGVILNEVKDLLVALKDSSLALRMTLLFILLLQSGVGEAHPQFCTLHFEF